MKSGKIAIVILIAMFNITLNGQVFIGGNFSFNSTASKTDASDVKLSSYSFNLNPKVGKFLSEKIAVGIEVDLSLSGTKTSSATESTTSSSTIGVSPFLRYYALKWNKLSLFGQGNAGIDFSSSNFKSGGTTLKGPKDTNLYLRVYPGLAYDVSEKLSLETSINILSFGYYYDTSKTTSYTETHSGFNIGAGLNNILNVGSITIGAIYKF